MKPHRFSLCTNRRVATLMMLLPTLIPELKYCWWYSVNCHYCLLYLHSCMALAYGSHDSALIGVVLLLHDTVTRCDVTTIGASSQCMRHLWIFLFSHHRHINDSDEVNVATFPYSFGKVNSFEVWFKTKIVDDNVKKWATLSDMTWCCDQP